MKGKAHSQEKIIGILREVESGEKVAEVCRRHGISDATFYTWRKKYQGMNVDEAKRLKKLEDENARLKRLIADQALDIAMLKEINTKKW